MFDRSRDAPELHWKRDDVVRRHLDLSCARRTAADRLPASRNVTRELMGDPPPGRSAQDELERRTKDPFGRFK